jgi:hypothetical protein
VSINNIVEAEAPYVQADDVPALEWIRNNTPASARFMVNTFHFGFSDNYVIGSDAGYWLPLLARRASITAPMIYPAERATSSDFLERLVVFDRLQGKLTTPEALALLQREDRALHWAARRMIMMEKIAVPSFKRCIRIKGLCLIGRASVSYCE